MDHCWKKLEAYVMWRCETCGSELASLLRPENDSHSPFVATFSTKGWKPSPIRIDCHQILTHNIMES